MSMRFLPLLALAAISQMAAAAPPPEPAPPTNGMHPDSHAPDGGITEHRARPPIVQPVLYRAPRSGVNVNGHWRMTAGHVRACRHRYRTYNPHTNRYVARRGVHRVCVL